MTTEETAIKACRRVLPQLVWYHLPPDDWFAGVGKFQIVGVLGDRSHRDAPFYVIVSGGAKRAACDGYLNPLVNGGGPQDLDGDTPTERLASLVALVASAKDEAYTEAGNWLELAKGLE